MTQANSQVRWAKMRRTRREEEYASIYYNVDLEKANQFSYAEGRAGRCWEDYGQTYMQMREDAFIKYLNAYPNLRMEQWIMGMVLLRVSGVYVPEMHEEANADWRAVALIAAL